MIDIHSHTIPNIDDGSKSFEESYIMFNEAKNAGFTDIICTSHYMENYYETNTIERAAWVKAMNKILADNNVGVKLHIGAEIYISQNMLGLIKNKKVCTLANSKYVLFELPMNSTINYLDDVVFELQSAGLVPIIAHPERYLCVQKDPNMVVKLVEKGVLFQANYGSVIGLYGTSAKNTLKKLLQADAIHFLGTDVHRQNTIYINMEQILVELNKIVEEDKLEMLTTLNAEKILNNEDIQIEIPNKIKKWIF